MKKNLEVVFQNMDGTEITMQDKTPLTMKSALLECLLATPPSMVAEEKSRRWQLCQKIRKGNTINITIEEAALIKKAAGEVNVTLVYGQIEDWLEGGDDDHPSA